MNTIDVVIVTAGRRSHLQDCLRSVLGWQDVRVIVVVNGYDGETVLLLEALARENRRFTYAVCEKKVPKSRARNTGLSMASADIVYFLDDDAVAAGDNAAIVRQKFADHPGIDVVGGPNLTPAASTFFQRVSGYALSSPLVSWKMQQRYTVRDEDRLVDDQSLILCNLAIRRDVLVKEKVCFDEQLEYNEENLLLQRLKRRGHRMLYSPELVVYHARRKNMVAYARQVFKSGEGRAVMTILFPQSFSPVYAFPSLFLIYLICFAAVRSSLYSAPLFVYAGASLINALCIVIKNRARLSALLLLFIFPLLSHCFYGTGFVYGIGRMLVWKRLR
jgi:glycosyltransferase involved in cell wall biosynthesis